MFHNLLRNTFLHGTIYSSNASHLGLAGIHRPLIWLLYDIHFRKLENLPLHLP